MIGQDLTNTLVCVLMRFREEPVAFMTHVDAMFYPVQVQPDDCKYLQFLWWPHCDLGKEPEEYHMLVTCLVELHLPATQTTLSREQKVIKKILTRLP